MITNRDGEVITTDGGAAINNDPEGKVKKLSKKKGLGHASYPHSTKKGHASYLELVTVISCMYGGPEGRVTFQFFSRHFL